MNYFTDVFKANTSDIAPLNGIRSIGIFMLFYCHLYRFCVEMKILVTDYPLVSNFYNNASFAMDLFFVLSGFLISAPILLSLKHENKFNVKSFFIKRTLRIFPPYYAFLMIQYFIIVPYMVKMDPANAATLNELKSNVIFDVLYVSNYYKGIVFHGWSLSLEEQFYLIFPLFMLLFHRIPERWQLKFLITLAALPLLYRAIFTVTVMAQEPQSSHIHLYNKYLYYPFHGHIDSILYGIILAYIYNFRRQWIDYILSRPGLSKLLQAGVWALFLPFLIFANEYESGFFQVIRFTFFSIMCAIFMVLSFREGSWLRKFLSWRGFYPIAKLSYCAYLIHVAVLVEVMQKVFRGGQATHLDIIVWVIPMGLVIFFFAYLFHLVAERPFMLLRHFLLARSKSSNNSIDIKPAH